MVPLVHCCCLVVAHFHIGLVRYAGYVCVCVFFFFLYLCAFCAMLALLALQELAALQDETDLKASAAREGLAAADAQTVAAAEESNRLR